MRTNNFPTSLFDFDFSAELGTNYRTLEEYQTRLARHTARLTAVDANPLEPRTQDPEERAERVKALREMAENALQQDRMGAYFRLLDSIEAYEIVSEPTPRPADYGIPEVKLSYVAESSERPTASGSDDLHEIFRKSFEAGELQFREFFKVAYLDNRNRIIGIQTISTGGMDGTVVDVRIIMTGALLAHASKIAACHNHPSGGTTPSTQDDRTTRRIADAGKIMGIPLIDHIIIGESDYYSYFSEGKLYMS